MGPDDALAEIPEATAQDETAPDRLGHGADTGHQNGQHDHGDPEEHGHQGRSAGEQAERQAGVELEGQPEGPPHMDGIVEWSSATVVVTRSATTMTAANVEGHKPRPSVAARVQRRDSPPLLQATQSRAYGRARRRGLGIGWKHRSQ